MPQETYIVAYEGGSRGVVNYAASHAKQTGAKLHIVHVLEWSPYSFLTPEEIEERHKRRKEELDRANKVVMQPVLKKLHDAGVTADGEIRYGNVTDLIVEIARDRSASMIFVGKSGSGSVASRVFGSVPIGLAYASPVPTVIVP
ncbi:universal stress protein [Rhodobacteraceae bacterium NNCM2]|nr:universal stress protein [Coraliihabitans acroporae]